MVIWLKPEECLRCEMSFRVDENSYENSIIGVYVYGIETLECIKMPNTIVYLILFLFLLHKTIF